MFDTRTCWTKQWINPFCTNKSGNKTSWEDSPHENLPWESTMRVYPWECFPKLTRFWSPVSTYPNLKGMILDWWKNNSCGHEAPKPFLMKNCKVGSPRFETYPWTCCNAFPNPFSIAQLTDFAQKCRRGIAYRLPFQKNCPQPYQNVRAASSPHEACTE